MLTIILTALITIFLVSVFFIVFTRKNAITTVKSKYGFEETCKRLENTINKAEGWGLPIDTWDFYQFQKNKNLNFESIKNCKIYFVCNPKNANMLVSNNPELSGLIPCSWTIYEDKNGNVYVSKINISLMSKIFSGIPGKIMKNVAIKSKEFLKEITQ
ncbi:conserved hypothetical protein [Thermotomaculum hydrothermale]|uniref:DUF302 domain-containing protein n=1 Tax=Thermotomaculum hydrothermale TaxID=981385 RepID=A0A7R6SXH6_9BACT|nr:DUF302 domain-containing protein [Thermotomaculum hydrothermale]BBB31799.1 conserved hypothetical protein [Thermotomaculum hydrothermale]